MAITMFVNMLLVVMSWKYFTAIINIKGNQETKTKMKKKVGVSK